MFVKENMCKTIQDYLWIITYSECLHILTYNSINTTAVKQVWLLEKRQNLLALTEFAARKAAKSNRSESKRQKLQKGSDTGSWVFICMQNSKLHILHILEGDGLYLFIFILHLCQMVQCLYRHWEHLCLCTVPLLLPPLQNRGIIT